MKKLKKLKLRDLALLKDNEMKLIIGGYGNDEGPYSGYVSCKNDNSVPWPSENSVCSFETNGKPCLTGKVTNGWPETGTCKGYTEKTGDAYIISCKCK
jgi:natural product precursor